ncbi:uncharacterized protein L201_004468 [Kwoniella dendrophila CBS 6074]|uniref:Uncharacterized protein n=1 Tax=Kwoniella dendrophila CBS 6074 TaxID=1295534 RepID=A0AAX4JXH4_9TREE
MSLLPISLLFLLTILSLTSSLSSLPPLPSTIIAALGSSNSNTTSQSNQNQSQYDQGGINIPTSTVISIGLGFLAFSFMILMILLGFRLNRIRKLTKTTNKSFKQIWNDEGGFWGFLTSFGEESNSNQSRLIGATGRTLNYGYTDWYGFRSPFIDLLRERDQILQDQLQEELDKAKLKEKPVLWDYKWHQNIIDDDDKREIPHFVHEEIIQPISIVPSSTPQSNTKVVPLLPSLNLCVLIAFPSETPYNHENAEELPELIIGSTILLPTTTITPKPAIPIPTTHISINRTETNSTDGKDSEDVSKKVEIREIEYSNINVSGQDNHQGKENSNTVNQRFRAEWKQDKDKGIWYIDGLQ